MVAISTAPYIDRVRLIRLAGRVTQRRLATQLRTQGWKIDDALISRYENGLATPVNRGQYEDAVKAAVEALVGK